jgi:lysophospholipase L1-like esterase
MKRLLLLLWVCPAFAQYPDWITRFETDIKKLEAQPSVPEGVVFAGNSNFTLWGAMATDLAPIPVIRRGFGGSTTIELRYYADRIVTKYRPKAVVICEGENDFGRGYTAQSITDVHRDLIAHIRGKRADTDIVILALKPSPFRWDKWPAFQQTNALLKSLCASLSRCLYIDASSPLMKNGVPDPLLFRDDRLHMNLAGYAKWTAFIKPKLTEFLSQPPPVSKVPKPPEDLSVD